MSKKVIKLDKPKTAQEVVSLLNEKSTEHKIIFLPGDSSLEVERIPVGLKSLDEIMGGGLPVGRVLEVFGLESGGKTTLALHMVAAVQKQGKLAAFVDAEHSLDLFYANSIGVDTENLIVSQPMSAEEVFEVLYDIVDHCGIVVVDSTAALMPQSDLENPQPGSQARIISQGIRKLVHKLSLSGAIIVFLSQLRNTFARWGSSTASTGGKSLKFYASVRLEVKISRRGGVIRKGKPVGNVVKIRSAKNKTYAPFKEEEFNLIYGEGLSERKKRST